MNHDLDVAGVARLIGNPARATMLDLLLDGRTHSAGELGREARVAPSTASSHLADLVDGELITAERVGRQQLYQIADPRVARAMEALAILAPGRRRRSLRQAINDGHLRSGRTCYDHLAGGLGVALTDALIAERVLRPRNGAFAITQAGEDRLAALGVDVAGARKRRRGYALACLDWSERRPHLAGALGAALCDHLFSLGWISRRPGGRGVVVTSAGMRGLREDLGLDLHEDTGPGRDQQTSSEWRSRR